MKNLINNKPKLNIEPVLNCLDQFSKSQEITKGKAPQIRVSDLSHMQSNETMADSYFRFSLEHTMRISKLSNPFNLSFSNNERVSDLRLMNHKSGDVDDLNDRDELSVSES